MTPQSFFTFDVARGIPSLRSSRRTSSALTVLANRPRSPMRTAPRYWMYAAPESHYRVVGLRLFEQMPVVASSQFAVAVVKGVIGVLIVAFAFLERWSLAACAFPLLL